MSGASSVTLVSVVLTSRRPRAARVSSSDLPGCHDRCVSVVCCHKAESAPSWLTLFLDFGDADAEISDPFSGLGALVHRVSEESMSSYPPGVVTFQGADDGVCSFSNVSAAVRHAKSSKTDTTCESIL